MMLLLMMSIFMMLSVLPELEIQQKTCQYMSESPVKIIGKRPFDYDNYDPSSLITVVLIYSSIHEYKKP